jgi:uncharacterized protein
MKRRSILLLTAWLCACQPKFRAREELPEQKAEPPRGAHRPPSDSPAINGAEEAVQVDEALYQRVEWKQLRGLNVSTGKVSEATAKLLNASVHLTGYMVPFDDESETVSEFLFVPGAGMCIHLPPPPPNQIILVILASGATTRVHWSQPIELFGQLESMQTDSPYGAVGWQIMASAARVRND